MAGGGGGDGGSIPACAGEPVRCQPIHHRSSVYPRVCGGTSSGSRTSAQSTGLSPRVRGNHLRGADLSVADRSIPACAGEPQWYNCSPTCFRVYPRVCGGTRGANLRGADLSGLSPRVRGNRLSSRSGGLATRSIPACAGEPAVCGVRLLSVTVYPRVCGGTWHGFKTAYGCHGLSPRVRGNHRPQPPHTASSGSIPACAGEPWVCRRQWPPRGVYPRVCGGTEVGSPLLVPYSGLSPRVRGNQHALNSPRAMTRSIPACAGEPSTRMTRGVGSRVYPRVCGGT